MHDQLLHPDLGVAIEQAPERFNKLFQHFQARHELHQAHQQLKNSLKNDHPSSSPASVVNPLELQSRLCKHGAA